MDLALSTSYSVNNDIVQRRSGSHDSNPIFIWELIVRRSRGHKSWCPWWDYGFHFLFFSILPVWPNSGYKHGNMRVSFVIKIISNLNTVSIDSGIFSVSVLKIFCLLILWTRLYVRVLICVLQWLDISTQTCFCDWTERPSLLVLWDECRPEWMYFLSLWNI